MALKKHGFIRISKNKTYGYPILLREVEALDKENKKSGDKYEEALFE